MRICLTKTMFDELFTQGDGEVHAVVELVRGSAQRSITRGHAPGRAPRAAPPAIDEHVFVVVLAVVVALAVEQRGDDRRVVSPDAVLAEDKVGQVGGEAGGALDPDPDGHGLVAPAGVGRARFVVVVFVFLLVVVASAGLEGLEVWHLPGHACNFNLVRGKIQENKQNKNYELWLLPWLDQRL